MQKQTKATDHADESTPNAIIGLLTVAMVTVGLWWLLARLIHRHGRDSLAGVA